MSSEDAQKLAVNRLGRRAVETRSEAGVSAVSSVVVADPRPSKAIPPNVLQEEVYTDAVSAIIERDFFPDLPQLRLRQALIAARSAGDQDRAEELLWQLLKGPRPTPLSATPASAALAGPGDTPRPADARSHAGNSAPSRGGEKFLSAWERESEISSLAGRSSSCDAYSRLRLANGKDVVVDLSTARLDDFQRVFTSEDNASFDAIVQREKKKLREKEWWVDQQEKDYNTLHKTQARALENGGSIEPGQQMFCPHKARNALFLKKAGMPQHELERPKCDFKNTRFTSAQHTEQDQRLGTAMAARNARLQGDELEERRRAMAAEGKFMAGSTAKFRTWAGRHAAEDADAPLGFVHTPSFLPGENVSPLMTFGQLGSTPRVLESEDGPSFKIYETSPREQAAEKLQRGCVSRLREAKQQQKLSRLRQLGLSATPSSGGRTPGSSVMRSTPMSMAAASRVSPLSPIGQLIHRAQKLAQKGGRLRIAGGDDGHSASAAKRRRTSKAQGSATHGLLDAD